MLTRTREKLLIFLYFISMVLSLLLCYYSGIYCQHSKCWAPWFVKNHQPIQESVRFINNSDSTIQESKDDSLTDSYQIFEIFVMCTALLILLLSFLWLLGNSVFKKAEIRQIYSRFEMPTAVTCSLFAGICAVTEFHHSLDFSYLHWSEKWKIAGIDATVLSVLHAIIAFALQ